MIQLGSAALAAAFWAGSLTFLLSLAAAVRKDPALLVAARWGTILAALLTAIASAGLVHAFIAGDYSLSYVFGHSDRDMPLFYKIGAFWGGQEGSLLFWALLLSLFAAGVAIRHRREPVDWFAPVLATIGANLVFFLGLVLFLSNPFDRIPGFTPADGRGLNPLLQHPSMIIHPPSLYIGLVGLVVPFAMAVGALVSGRTDDGWVRMSRFWAMLAWIFLGAGNVIGGRWAYVELGWGGYWAWDPVENSSLLPWLAATAYLHSIMMQKQRGMLKIWTISLAIAMYLLTILGTFITRSGLIKSVHAFAKSNIGFYLLGFLLAGFLVSLVLLFRRLKQLRSEQRIEALISREAFFLLANVILILAVFSVLWGTLSPAVTEMISGRKISVGPAYFNRMMIPFGLLLLFMAGTAPRLPWSSSRPAELCRAFWLPAVAGGLAALAGGILGSFGWALAAQALCVFVAVAIVQSIGSGVNERRRQSDEPLPVSLWRALNGNKRWTGGHIVHFGVLLVFLGFSGNAFKMEKDAGLLPGESVEIKNYTLTYLGMESKSRPGVEEVGVNLLLNRGGKDLAILVPKKNWYEKSRQRTSEVAIHTSLLEDFYVAFGGYEGKKISIRIFLNPLVQFFWIGSFVMGIGALLTVLPLSRRRT